MIHKQLDYYLTNHGWKKINTNIKEFTLYSIQINQQTYGISILDDCAGFLTHPLLLEHLLEQTEPLFSNTPYPYQTLCIVLTNHPSRTKTMIEGNHAKWLIDVSSSKLIIFENQPSEFLNFRSIIEQLCNPQATSTITTSAKISIFSSIKQKLSIFWKANSVVNFTIILLNILAFLVTEIIGNTQSPSFMHLCGAISSSDLFLSHEYFRTISSIFLHFGIQHLLSNMIVLWALGTSLERLIGSIRYLAIYLISGIGANIISMLWYWHNGEYYIVSAGASGAIFGVVGALLYIVLRNKGHVHGVSSRQLIWLCIFTFAHGLLSMGVNNSAHLVGLFIGIFCGIIFYRHKCN